MDSLSAAFAAMPAAFAALVKCATPALEMSKRGRVLMDESLKTAITRLGDNLRVAGTAELGNRQSTLREQALQTLLKVWGFRAPPILRPRTSGWGAVR